MQTDVNPFQFGAANDFSPEKVLEYYIEDFNYARFIHSKRNIYILGERGSGKTMTLLYHSLTTQRRKAERDGFPCPLEYIGVYIPCNTPLMHRKEYELLTNFKAEVLSEHFLTLGIAHWLAKTLEENRELVGEANTEEMSEELGYVIGHDLPEKGSFFKRVLGFVRRETRETQIVINRADSDAFYDRSLTFGTLLMPLFELLRQFETLSESHFLLLIDDAHDLNEHQVRAVNSWIAYRDHSLFSIKVATVKVQRPSLITSTGGSILEGHDYTVVDMEKPLQNEQSDFGRLATRIVARRLERIGSSKEPSEFFPIHESVKRGLGNARKAAEAEARTKFPNGTQRQISDYVYKYHRAIYFRRAATANLPVYSGFKTIVYLSTGVVRNLLEPCYWMYDKAVSIGSDETENGAVLDSVNPTIQNDVIMEQSAKKWDQIREGLDKVVVDCSEEDAAKVKRLFEALAQLFRKRLLGRGSEPRATSFSISGRADENVVQELDHLLKIARKATLLYTREGPAKDHGAREYYYVPNRMLWPVRGLDPQGQHARVQLPASRLLSSACGNEDLSSAVEDVKDDKLQGWLFDG